MKKKQILFFCLSVLATVFIFSNSLKNAEISSGDSGRIVKLVQNIISLLNIENSLSVSELTVIVRKAAHITEFALQSLFVSGFVSSLWHKLREKAPAVLLCGILTACCDETIQIFSIGRSSSVIDVFIDFIGVILGLCTAFAVLYFRRAWGSRR